MQRWEYRVLHDISLPEINDLGDDGWEVVMVEFDDEGEILSAFAKRPKSGGGASGGGQGGGQGGARKRRRRRGGPSGGQGGGGESDGNRIGPMT